jgi:hypothetical protein
MFSPLISVRHVVVNRPALAGSGRAQHGCRDRNNVSRFSWNRLMLGVQAFGNLVNDGKVNTASHQFFCDYCQRVSNNREGLFDDLTSEQTVKHT